MKIISPGLGPTTVWPVNMVFLGAVVTNVGITNLPTGTETLLTFNGEDYDAGSWHSTVTNTGRLTVPSGVTRVILAAKQIFEANATGTRRIRLYKNGALMPSPVEDELRAAAPSGDHHAYLITRALSVAAGDYFELAVTQNSGVTLMGNMTQSYFSIRALA